MSDPTGRARPRPRLGVLDPRDTEKKGGIRPATGRVPDPPPPRPRPAPPSGGGGVQPPKKH